MQRVALYGPALNNKYDATIGTLARPDRRLGRLPVPEHLAPGRRGDQLPVIVWVHGGSNISGYTADPMYDGANLARTANAVVVSVNYRLGVFGFFNMAQLKTGERRTTRATSRSSTSSRR